jgi:peptidoglycan hydrolase FlgJ
MAAFIPVDRYQLFTGCADSAENLNQHKGAIMLTLPPVLSGTASHTDRQGTLHQKAQELEAAFLAEMLSHAGFGAARDSFGGGIGEEQFASFLRTEQATAMVKKGGIGLAEHFFQSLTAQDQANA